MTDVPDHVPVLVVGGGPSGLSAAIELVQEALTVLELGEPQVRHGAQPLRSDLDRRLARLLRKAAGGRLPARRWIGSEARLG